MVDRCLDAMEEPDMFVGEKAATVGGFGSYEGCGVDEPLSGVKVDLEDMDASQGVSEEVEQVSIRHAKLKEHLRWKGKQTKRCHTTGRVSSCECLSWQCQRQAGAPSTGQLADPSTGIKCL